MKQIKKYVIVGLRWFDKINGNTYHTVNIVDVNSNETIFKSENMEYGYSDAYRQTAYKQLIKMKLAKEEDRYNHNLNRERFIYICNDVTRKKDLF